jgi:CBS domain-containing protein
MHTLFEKDVVTASPEDTLTQVAQTLEQHKVGAIVVVEEHKPVGIVTDRDLALAVCVRGISPTEPVRRVMSSPVATLKHTQGVFEATRQMKQLTVRRLPVVDDDGKLVGLVSLDDLLLLLTSELGNLAVSVREEMGET